MANYTRIKGLTAFDSENKKVGTIADLYYDDDESSPTWATVKTGLFGTKVNFVPLKEAQQTEDGVQLAVTEEQVKNAPSIDVDEELPESDEDRLYEHYGFTTNGNETEARDREHASGEYDEADRERVNPDASTAAGTAGAAGAGIAGAGANATDRDRDGVGSDRRDVDVTDGNRTDGTRSTGGSGGQDTDHTSVHGGRMRLKKYIVTENVQVTVPVQREVVELEPDNGEASDRRTDDTDRR